MNINDPFGRLKKQREKEYHSLCQTLQDAGVNNRHDAQELMETLLRRGKIGILIVVPFTLILGTLFGEAQLYIYVVGFLIAVWLFKTTTRSRQHIKRYIEEELTNEEDSREF